MTHTEDGFAASRQLASQQGRSVPYFVFFSPLRNCNCCDQAAVHFTAAAAAFIPLALFHFSFWLRQGSRSWGIGQTDKHPRTDSKRARMTHWGEREGTFRFQNEIKIKNASFYILHDKLALKRMFCRCFCFLKNGEQYQMQI